MRYTVDGKIISFDRPLEVGTIIDRPNRFIANVKVGSDVVKCHCPVTGSIGGFKLDGMPCLISKAEIGSKRSTTHTMEAFSPWQLESLDFQWIGINQTKVNRYIEEFITNGELDFGLFGGGDLLVRREVKVAGSRIDFLVSNASIETLVEVKMPVKNLQVILPDDVIVSDPTATGTNRMYSQLGDIGDWLDESSTTGIRRCAVLTTVFMYDNPGFVIPKSHNGVYSSTAQRIGEVSLKDFLRWQVNLSIDQDGVKLVKNFPL